MLLVPNVTLVCLIFLSQINDNAAERTRRIKYNTRENREVLKKLVNFLNNNERTKANDNEPTVINIIDDVDIHNPDEMRTVMKHLQKNYDYEIMADLTQAPRVHVIRNPDVLDEFVDTLQREEPRHTNTPNILKSTVRRYGDAGFGQAISAEKYGRRSKVNKRDKYSYQSNYENNNKKKRRFESRERFDKRKTYYSDEDRDYNRQKYGSRERFNKRDKYDSRESFDSREKYSKNNYNNNKGSRNTRNKENSYNRHKDTSDGGRNKHNTRNKYDTRNKFDSEDNDKTTFRSNKLKGSIIRSRDDDEKGLDIPENNFKKPPIITLNLGMSSENTNKKNDHDSLGDKNYVSKVTLKDWIDSVERTKKMVHPDNEWGSPALKLPNKAMDWSEVGIEKTTERNYNDWSQVGIDKNIRNKEWRIDVDKKTERNNNDWGEVGNDKSIRNKERNYKDWSQVGVDKNNVRNKEWRNAAIDPHKDWAAVGIDKKSSSKRYYNDEELPLKEQIEEFTTKYAAYKEKKKIDLIIPTRSDWDQPIRNYENKYKNNMEKLYTYENKRQKPDVRSDISYHSFGRTPIPFVGKRIVYADS